jgi:hypothetical protein
VQRRLIGGESSSGTRVAGSRRFGSQTESSTLYPIEDDKEPSWAPDDSGGMPGGMYAISIAIRIALEGPGLSRWGS